MVELIEINQQGLVLGQEDPDGLSREAIMATAAMYGAVRFVRPQIGYLVRQEGEFIGIFGFKGPPVQQQVEIACFSFPKHEGQGIAIVAARHLVELAKKLGSSVLVSAHTLPEKNASTRILRELGFSLLDSVQDAEDGEVWEWRLHAGSHENKGDSPQKHSKDYQKHNRF